MRSVFFHLPQLSGIYAVLFDLRSYGYLPHAVGCKSAHARRPLEAAGVALAARCGRCGESGARRTRSHGFA